MAVRDFPSVAVSAVDIKRTRKLITILFFIICCIWNKKYLK